VVPFFGKALSIIAVNCSHETEARINPKKLSHLKAACALHFAHYNFCRIHQTLRVTPAMEAGISDHVWTVEEITSLLDKSATIAA
jgi:hypothetical protein